MLIECIGKKVSEEETRSVLRSPGRLQKCPVLSAPKEGPNRQRPSLHSFTLPTRVRVLSQGSGEATSPAEINSS